MPEQMFGSVESYKQQKKYLDFLNKINNGLNRERKQKKKQLFKDVFFFSIERFLFLKVNYKNVLSLTLTLAHIAVSLC